MIVSNSSGLIHVTKLSKALFLREYAERVLIPEAVHTEVVERGKKEGYLEADSIESFEREGWITVEPLKPKYRRLAVELGGTLGRGEAEAIALASQNASLLLIDDDHGRRAARYYKVNTLSTLGMLLEFLLSGKIRKQEYANNVRRFSSQAWIGSDVVEEFLRKADESD